MVYFICGIMFVVIVQPIAEQLASVIVNWLEVVKMKAVAINTQISKELNMDIPQDSYAIGFHVPNEEVYIEDDDE